ncbi:NAD-specific glutamate dehydrogenase [Thauera sp. 28]|nr:NAD-specific glutamate dehydrogenase [Thauera sp. 28]
MFGSEFEFVDLVAGERSADAVVHAACSKVVGGARESVDARLDRTMVVAGKQGAQVNDRCQDGVTFVHCQQSAILVQRVFCRLDHTLCLDLLLAQRARAHVFASVLDTRSQHAGDLLVGQPIGWLDEYACLDARGHLARGHRQQTIRINLEADTNTGCARHHRWNAAQFEASERAAVGDELALALDDMESHRGLAILEGGEFLRASAGERRIARNDLLDQPSHGLQTERKRNDIEQQPVVLRRTVAGKYVRLHRGAQRDDLVGVQIGERLLAEVARHGTLDVGHAGGAADHDHALDFVRSEPRVTQGLAHRAQGLLHEGLGHFRELVAADDKIHLLARGQPDVDGCLLAGGEKLLRLARLHLQTTCILERRRRDARLVENPAEQTVVEVIAAQGRIAIGRQHLEDAARELEDGQVECAAAEVIDRIDAFGSIVQAICDCRGGGLVEQAQHVDPGQARSILGRLALCIVKIGRHRDDRPYERPAKAGLRTLAQPTQDLGRNLDRALDALHGPQAHHAGAVLEVVRHGFDVRNILEPTTHEALDRDDRVTRIDRLGFERSPADLKAAVAAVTDRRRQHRPPTLIGQAHGNPVTDGRNERIGGTEVDAYREPVLVRLGRHAGFSDLQQGHQLVSVRSFQFSRAISASSISCWSLSMNMSRRTVSAAPSKS